MTAVMRDCVHAVRHDDAMIRGTQEVTRYCPTIETIRPSSIDWRARRIANKTKSTARDDRINRPPWFGSVVERLGRFLSLGENWNGYGENAITAQAVVRTMNLLTRVAMDGPEPAVVPMSDGGIQIEWHYGGTEIEVEVPSDGRELSVYATLPGGRVLELPERSPRDPIWPALRARIAAL